MIAEKQPTRLSGRYGWNILGESLWCICAKLIVINQLGYSEFQRALGVERSHRSFRKKSQCDFRTLEGFNLKLIVESTASTEDTIRYCVADDYVLGTHDAADELRYCEICIKNGFHSPFHQITEHTHCLWHGELLRTGCFTCSRRIEYSVSRCFVTAPFECPIGHRVLTSDLRYKAYPGLSDDGRQQFEEYVQHIANLKARIRKPGRSFPVSLFQDGIEHRQLPHVVRRLGRCPTRQKIVTSIMPDSAEQRTVLRRRRSLTEPHGLLKEKDNAHGLFLTWQGELSHWQRDSIAKYFKPILKKTASSADEAVRIRFLRHHGACWGLSLATDSWGFEKGLSCVWRAAYAIWRIRFSVLLSQRSKGISIWQQKLTSDSLMIYRRFLQDCPYGWASYRYESLLVWLVQEHAKHVLIATYLDIVREVSLQYLHVREREKIVSIDELIDISADSNPNCSFFVSKGKAENSVNLLIQDSFSKAKQLEEACRAGEHSLFEISRFSDRLTWAPSSKDE